jgi:hypothetical protein
MPLSVRLPYAPPPLQFLIADRQVFKVLGRGRYVISHGAVSFFLIVPCTVPCDECHCTLSPTLKELLMMLP